MRHLFGSSWQSKWKACLHEYASAFCYSSNLALQKSQTSLRITPTLYVYVQIRFGVWCYFWSVRYRFWQSACFFGWLIGRTLPFGIVRRKLGSVCKGVGGWKEQWKNWSTGSYSKIEAFHWWYFESNVTVQLWDRPYNDVLTPRNWLRTWWVWPISSPKQFIPSTACRLPSTIRDSSQLYSWSDLVPCCWQACA